MDIYKSKYTSLPDNSSLDRRMADGESLEEIFDDTDYLSKCYTEDELRPIKVRIGRKYNYVANKFLLFDNWFVLADDFQEGDSYSFAYRRFNENGIREGGVLIKRDGSYVTRDEFIDINYGNHNGHGRYAIVKQYNGLFNVIDVTTGRKMHSVGLNVDCIAVNNINRDSDIFIIAKGNIKNLHDLDWWESGCGKEIAETKGIKINFCSFNKGILSPSMWFDYSDGFQISSKGTLMKTANFAVVYLNEKANFITINGKLLSALWFDVASVYGGGEFGIAGILKFPSCKHLPDYINEDFDYNPAKYTLYKVNKDGKITQLF